MNSVLVAPAIMAGLGLFFGVLLAVSNRLLKVEEDPRIEGTNELLPGSNCGACGEPGCLAFAEKLVAGEVSPGSCTGCNEQSIEDIALYLGVDAGVQEKKVARLSCAGGRAQAHQIAEYNGFEGCRAAALVSGGGKGCSWGCLGLGDCEVACTFDAIRMNANGLPEVDPDKCMACPDCTNACPKNLFEVLPVSQKLFVQCSIPFAAEDASSLCKVACDACSKCALDAPDLIHMEGNLPVLDYASGAVAQPETTYRCASNTIVWIEYSQFQNSQHLAKGGNDRYA